MRRPLALLVIALMCCVPAWADITVSGQVSPPDPADWTSETSISIGGTELGVVRVDDGSIVDSSAMILGSELGSRGELTIADIGSRWTNTGPTLVGYRGLGILSVESGGAYYADHPFFHIGAIYRGEVRVDGAGSTLTASRGLRIGYEAAGTLSITGGASAVSNEYTYVGERATASVLVHGDGSTFEATFLGVGSYADASLDVTHAGRLVTNGSSRIAAVVGTKGRITVDGPGSLWNAKGRIYIGIRGDGELVVSNGGQIESVTATLADGVGSKGRVVLRGPDTAWVNIGDLELGPRGDAAISIADGALLAIARGAENSEFDFSGDTYLYTSESNTVNLASGGRLAFWGDVDESINTFLAHTSEPAAIRYFDNDLYAWSPITDAVLGQEYSLNYHTEGDLAGYTVLTVGYIPEPATLGIALVGYGLISFRVRR